MKHSILKDIIKCSKKAKGCKLKAKYVNSDLDYLKRLDHYFNTIRIQTLFIVAVFDLNSQSQKPQLADLASYFKCSSLELFVYKSQLTELYKMGIFEMPHYLSFFNPKLLEIFEIAPLLRECIADNQPFKVPKEETLNPIDFADNIYQLIDDENVTDVKEQFEVLLKTHETTDFIKYLRRLRFENNDMLVYLYAIGANISGHRKCSLSRIVSGFIKDKSEKAHYLKNVCDSKTILTKENYIELIGSDFIYSQGIYLSKKSGVQLEKFGIPISLVDSKSDIKLLDPNSIHKKRLFFNDDSKKKIDDICNILRTRKYNQITKALESEGYRKGVCILLYGSPGTGKTEAVFQIARQTNRQIWKVDLSELKSAWFGESQKLVKSLFKNYTSICSGLKSKPILLLNEADAILGKRNAQASRGTDQTNNAIQNIFLDCLEDFEGILFATTNLEESLDKAFERRFLFKVNFERPCQKVQSNIWRSKIHGLSKGLALDLSSEYNFSGGEIENVARKFKMAKILGDTENTKQTLFDICQSEKLKTRCLTKEIGYKS